MSTESDLEHSPWKYQFDSGDEAFLNLIARILDTAMQEPSYSWAERTSVARMLHVLSRLPYGSTVEHLELGFVGPRVRYEDAEIYFYLDVGTQDDVLMMRFGGHFYRPSTGGDSFTVFHWTAAPGEPAALSDFRSMLGVLPHYVDPLVALNAIPQELSGYKLRVIDDTNALLDDEEPEEADKEVGSEAQLADAETEHEEDDDIGAPVDIVPVTAADAELLQNLSSDAISSTSLGGAYGIESCDGCGIDLSTVGLFVDGNSPRLGWGNYCAACCLAHGTEVAWGRGQLYAHQPDGSWKGVAGFNG